MQWLAQWLVVGFVVGLDVGLAVGLAVDYDAGCCADKPIGSSAVWIER